MFAEYQTEKRNRANLTTKASMQNPQALLYPHVMAYDAAMDPIVLPTSLRFTTPYTMRFRLFKMYVWACTNAASNDMYSYSKDIGTPHIRNKTTNQNLNVRST